MNYIKKLEAQVTDLKENQVQVETMLTELLAYQPWINLPAAWKIIM